MKKKLFITCEEATMICDKKQYNEATFMERLKFRIHLLMCKFCSLYSKQNNLLTYFYQSKAKECHHKIHTISKQEKEVLKRKLQEQAIQ